MTFEETWAEYSPMVEGIAAEYGRRFHTYGADREDFSQEMAEWLWKRERWLEDKRSEFEDDDEDGFSVFLARCLRNECTDYGVDIRAQAGGQDRETAYWYTKGEVEELLGSVFNPDAWSEAPQGEGGRARQRNPAHGGNWIATLADVSRALGTLSYDDRNLLELMHKHQWSNDVVAEYLGIGNQAAYKRHSRAIGRLLEALGGPRPNPMRESNGDPWRGRHAVAGAAARAATDEHW